MSDHLKIQSRAITHTQHRSAWANPNWTDRGDGIIDNHARPSGAASRSTGYKRQSQIGSAECLNTLPVQ